MKPVGERRGFGLALGLLVVIGLALRLVYLGADSPLSLSHSNAELQDGPWYLAAAIDGARGRPADVPAHFDLPIYTALARALFAVSGGPSFEAAHALPALLGGLLVLFAGLGARAAFGERAGLIAAGLLAVGFIPVGYGRTPLVYGPLAALLAAAFWAYAEAVRAATAADGRRAAAAAWGTAAVALVGALVVGLRVHAAIVLPGFAAGGLLLVQPRRRMQAALLVGAAVALGALGVVALAPALVRITGAKALLYMGADASWAVVAKRILNAPWVSGYTLNAPVLMLLGWLGVRAAWRRPAEGERGEHAVEVMLALWLVLWWLALSPFRFGESEQAAPPRHFVPALVPAAVLAGVLIDRALRGGASVPAQRAPWPVALVWGALLGYALQATVWRHVDIAWGIPAWAGPVVGALPMLGIATGACVLLLLGARARAAARSEPMPRTIPPAVPKPPWEGGPGRVQRGLAIAVLVIGILADVHNLAAEHPFTYTLKGANVFVRETLAPGARLTGSWAHAFTYDADQVSRHNQPPAASRLVGSWMDKTHLLVPGNAIRVVYDLCDAAGAARPIPVAILDVRGGASATALFRFAWAEDLGYRPTERERDLERRYAEGMARARGRAAERRRATEPDAVPGGGAPQ